jgi:putative membrane protein
MSLVELVVVWLWHLPALRLRVDMQPLALLIEQASFLGAGLLLWSAVLGTRNGGATDRRASGVAAMLLTSMHMTLLGALIGLAPRPLYAMMAMHPAAHGLDPLEDQQLGGVVMLMVGAASYFLGGLAMLGGLLKTRSATA